MSIRNIKEELWRKCQEFLNEFNGNDSISVFMEKYKCLCKSILPKNRTDEERITNYFKKYEKRFFCKLLSKSEQLKFVNEIKDYYRTDSESYEKYKEYYSYDLENDFYWNENGYYDTNEMFSKIEDEKMYELESFDHGKSIHKSHKKGKIYNKILKIYHRYQKHEDQFMFIFKYTEYWRVGIDVRYERISSTCDFFNRNLDDYITFYLLICPLVE